MVAMVVVVRMLMVIAVVVMLLVASGEEMTVHLCCLHLARKKDGARKWNADTCRCLQLSAQIDIITTPHTNTIGSQTNKNQKIICQTVKKSGKDKIERC